MTDCLAASAFVAFLSGCACVDVWHQGGGHTVCRATDSSWYLFDCIPLGTGDVSRPNERTYVRHKDGVGWEGNRKLLEWAREREGATGIGPVENARDKADVVPLLLQRYVLHSWAELLYGPDGRPGVPGPHDCIGARERTIWN